MIVRKVGSVMTREALACVTPVAPLIEPAIIEPLANLPGGQ